MVLLSNNIKSSNFVKILIKNIYYKVDNFSSSLMYRIYHLHYVFIKLFYDISHLRNESTPAPPFSITIWNRE